MLVALVVAVVALPVASAANAPPALIYEPFTAKSLDAFRIKYARFIEDELLDFYDNLTQCEREELADFYNEYMIQPLNGTDSWKTGFGLMEEYRPKLWEQLVPTYEALAKKIDHFNMNTKFYWVACIEAASQLTDREVLTTCTKSLLCSRSTESNFEETRNRKRCVAQHFIHNVSSSEGRWEVGIYGEILHNSLLLIKFVVRITLTDSPHLAAHYMTALGMLGEDFRESMHHKIRTDIQRRFPKLVAFLESQTFRSIFPLDLEKVRQRKRKGGAKAYGLKPIEYGEEVVIPFNDPTRNLPSTASAISAPIT